MDMATGYIRKVKHLHPEIFQTWLGEYQSLPGW